MAQGHHDGQYMIAFSTIGNAIPQGNPYQQQYPTHNQNYHQPSKTDFAPTNGPPKFHTPPPQSTPDTNTEKIYGAGIPNQYPAGYQTYGGHSSHQHLHGNQGINYLSSQNPPPGQLVQSIHPASQGQFYTLPHSSLAHGHAHQEKTGLQYSRIEEKTVLSSPTHVSPTSDTSIHRASPRLEPSPPSQPDFKAEKDAHVTAQSLINSTLFRTTIPLGPENVPASAIKMETPPPVKVDEPDGSGMSSVRSKEPHVESAHERPPPPTTAPPVGFTEDIDDYETVVVTNNHVVSAVVHNTDTDQESHSAKGTESVISSKSDIEKRVQGEVIYAKPKSVIERQSQVLILEAIQTRESAPEPDDDVYSVVNKPQENVPQKAPGIKTGEDDGDGIYNLPPVPQKTEESYKPKEDDIASMDSEGSALAAMHERAQAIRNDDEYYSNIEIEGSTMIIKDELDDYATVSGTTVDRTLQSPDATPQANGVIKQTPSKVIMDNDDDDYATVGDTCMQPPSPVPTDNTPDRNRWDIGATSSAAEVIPEAKASDTVVASPLKPSKTIDFSLPKGYRIGRTFNVFLYEHDITKLKVDAIVNAANGKLKHGSGVAKMIASAAGKEFEKDCKKLIKQFKELKVSTAVMTGAGKLQCKKVIHAVGPNWTDYKDKPKVSELLYSTFSNIFRVSSTEGQGIQSIALPPVSSGVFSVPNDRVAENLHQSILDLIDKMSEFPPPAQIHVVDIKPGFLQTLIEHFNGTVVTTHGSMVIVEELSRAEVDMAIGAISMQTMVPENKKWKKKLHSMPSLNRAKGKGPLMS